MSAIIDRHQQRLTFGGSLTRIYLTVDVSLVEHEDRTFEFCVDYSYTGTFGGRGRVGLPVSTDAAEEREAGRGFYIDYAIRNWQLTACEVSCDVTVAIRYKRFDIVNEYLFNDQRFAGPRLSCAPGGN